jgi:hypothetical protein
MLQPTNALPRAWRSKVSDTDIIFISANLQARTRLTRAGTRRCRGFVFSLSRAREAACDVWFDLIEKAPEPHPPEPTHVLAGRGHERGGVGPQPRQGADAIRVPRVLRACRAKHALTSPCHFV